MHEDLKPFTALITNFCYYPSAQASVVPTCCVYKAGVSNIRAGSQNLPHKDSNPACWTAFENMKEVIGYSTVKPSVL